MSRKKYLSRAEFSQWFSLNKEGILLWRKVPNNSRAVLGKEAGSIYNAGYRVVSLHGERYAYHKIKWILCNGDIPYGMVIDHINGDKLDNRLSNLRMCSNSENSQNQKIHREGKKPYSADFYQLSARDNFRFRVRKREALSKAFYFGEYNTRHEAESVCDFINSGWLTYILAATIKD